MTQKIEIKKRGNKGSIIIDSFVVYGDKADEASVYLEGLKLLSVQIGQKQAELAGNEDVKLLAQLQAKQQVIQATLAKDDKELTEVEVEHAKNLKAEVAELSKQLENSSIIEFLKSTAPAENLELQKQKDQLLQKYLEASLEGLETPIIYKDLMKDCLVSKKCKNCLMEAFLSEEENDWASFLSLIK